jgi:Subtilase family
MSIGVAQDYVVFDPVGLVGSSPPLNLLAPDITQALLSIPGFVKDTFKVEAVPSVTFVSGAHDPIELPPAPQEVFSVSFPGEENAKREQNAQQFRKAVRESIDNGDKKFHSVGVNPTMTVADYGRPDGADASLFGTLEDACRLIGGDKLPAYLSGQAVNIVVIDSGIDKNALPPGQFGGGWRPCPGSADLPVPPFPGMTTGEPALHGMMIVNNILAMAPAATIFDVPMIPPPKIYDIPSFLIMAHAVYRTIRRDIRQLRERGLFRGPWVFVNAWAIYDRRSEGASLGAYTENLGYPPFFFPHPFIWEIERVAADNFDIIFCAGNCGEVCPDDRCGPNDFGPGRGIWGANAHRDVLTVGGVRVDGHWLGFSSEGPGPSPNLYTQKPDICAPTQFVGTSGGYPPNTGTSSSAAITAGVVAALRSRPNWDQASVSPLVLKLMLNMTAQQPLNSGWNGWFGNGVLNAQAAYQLLLANFP